MFLLFSVALFYFSFVIKREAIAKAEEEEGQSLDLAETPTALPPMPRGPIAESVAENAAASRLAA